MNIESYRSSFSVYILDSDISRGQSVLSGIKNSDYDARLVLSFNDYKAQLRKSPPHILVMHYQDKEFAKDAFATREQIQKLLLQLPELHIILLAEESDLDECAAFYADGIYALLSYPVHPQSELLKSLDRAAQQNYFMYLNEQLKATDVGQGQAHIDYFEVWMEGLKSAKTPTLWINNTLKELHRIEPTFDYIYFKYISAKASLVVEDSIGLDQRSLESIGMDLRSSEPQFKSTQLLAPEKLLGLNELVKSGLQKSHFFAHTCIADKRIDGILVGLPKNDQMPVERNDSYIRTCLRILGLQIALFETRNKLERYSVIDESSAALNRSFFIQKINEEIVRARRIEKPISLLIIQLDQFHDAAVSSEEFEVDRYMKAVAAIFTKNSRLNDLVGRLGEDQFGLLLPHTDIKGSAIKAERLRRVIASADFAKVFPQKPKLTVSIGVAEYPRLALDGSDLLRKADQALSEVIKRSGNKVCVASVSDSFEPDFVIKDK